ncbi:DUF5682 family protein [Streptosporangium carneum]|uniref:Uncharacterized protein n=1 Tax=Streptosporangium carneum TaxID=47481 RepID=A0A9W6I8Y7_9ACTN|nr:DUF5682 family protein [Streptosporangium carneum]GLK14280.1 hypothetical protein GCM10017600_76920 [Streptosporangium carneum]
MTVSVLGVRHHGPGSARSLKDELERLRPDIVLVEGPPEADGLVELAKDPELEPPVALLAHVPGEPSRAAFWPFAVFSPEWQAIRYAVEAGVPLRFCDLPAAHGLAPGADAPAGEADDADAPGERGAEEGSGGEAADGEPAVRVDPIGALARAAGYDDPERWWEDVVEHRGDTPFQVIAEAMAAVREGHVADGHEARREAFMRRTIRRAVKEGFERIAVVCGAWHVPALAGSPDGAAAWGAGLPSGKADDALLRGLPKVKVEMTWVPWTYGRLAAWSGYGAGVTSPGWYHHLFVAPDRPVERWLTSAAGVLREEDLPVSSAHVIEAVRLARSLAVLRGRPLAGLAEATEAVRAVLCEGDDLPVELVQRRMVVGERLGHVPDSTPMVPLQRHLREEQRRLKLKPEALDREHDLDLRKPLDLERSGLLHRLRLLGVDWGTPQTSRSKGTFRESWTLAWRPEFDIDLIEASAWGTTVPAAATARVRDMAEGRAEPVQDASPGAGPSGPGARGGRRNGHTGTGGRGGTASAVSLATLTGLVERCLLADLPDALPYVLDALSARAALDGDVTHLMAALPAMVRAQRYGDVRGTPAAGLATIVDALLSRICVGLGGAVTGLDDAAARDLLGHVDAVHAAVALLQDVSAPSAAAPSHDAPVASAEALPGEVSGASAGTGGRGASGVPSEVLSRQASGVSGETTSRDASGESGETPRRRWLAALRGVSGRADLHGVIEGRFTRILLDAGDLDVGQAGTLMSKAMSAGHPPARAASWVEGFLSGGGLLLVHDPRLLALVDEWLTGLAPETFVDVLPLLRRTFGAFAAPERRSIGSRVRSLGVEDDDTLDEDVDEERAAAAVRTVLAILGRTETA